MSVLYDYFVACSDGEAAAMIEDGLDGDLLLLELKGLDPHDLVSVEALLTGAGDGTISERGHAPRIVASLHDNHNLVLALDDELRDALAGATTGKLIMVAASWARLHALVDQEDVDALADLLGQFAWLAREARDDSAHLYCRVGT
ncbi:hypothetical protein ACFO1B_51610 [Dactylosporangium siamense]|uniref:Uncharacterized protein n=1 Tax=Dactylosporangium siamense TaxID=685454 RepID=A0A919PJN0_9ACTN|nr:hypothetical protein [Dactylosporangium siamense]GIG43730.1 hypothetical protein Dsi01nite_017710 [Dactylosporangium siamense]